MRSQTPTSRGPDSAIASITRSPPAAHANPVRLGVTAPEISSTNEINNAAARELVSLADTSLGFALMPPAAEKAAETQTLVSPTATTTGQCAEGHECQPVSTDRPR